MVIPPFLPLYLHPGSPAPSQHCEGFPTGDVVKPTGAACTHCCQDALRQVVENLWSVHKSFHPFVDKHKFLHLAASIS